ncbi:hypothetical protein ACO0M4_31345 [Streptomyces sp. RGM 3693]|uniref:hypothetical protein n=1 Tax=Streptomyces sp. RGM 3693 TaxID=3413284 RepID=UPI003D2B9684
MLNPSRIAAAALLAALPVVGLAATAAPAQAAAPVTAQQPADGPNDDLFGGAGNNGVPSGIGDRLLGGFSDRGSMGLADRGSTGLSNRGSSGFGDRGSLLGGLR